MKDPERIESSASAFGTCRQRHAVEGIQRGRRDLGHVHLPGDNIMPRHHDGDAQSRLCAALDNCLRDIDPQCIAFFWPFRGEPDLRDLMERWSRSGTVVSLPAVEAAGKSVTFLAWNPGSPTGARLWGMPIPRVGTQTVEPDVIIVPLRDSSVTDLDHDSAGSFYWDAFARFPGAVRIGVGTRLSGHGPPASADHAKHLDFVITEVSTHGIRSPDLLAGK